MDAREEFCARVAGRLAGWQRNYDAAGVSCASPLMDEMIASEEVAADMRHERLQVLGGCLWVVMLDLASRRSPEEPVNGG